MVEKKTTIPLQNKDFMTSQSYVEKKATMPGVISAKMARSVSNYRLEKLADEVEQGKMSDGNQMFLSSSGGVQKSGDNSSVFSDLVRHSSHKIKTAADTTTNSGGYRGSGGTLRQAPSIYSPLWLDSNLNFPRDRATINSWSRAYFALNGMVKSAISLHSTYPISKLNIKCKDPKVEQFFAEMIEEIDLINICIKIAQEYWLLGEAFVYAELDETDRKWSRLIVQNPDYMVIQPSAVAEEPVISMRPDDNLRRLVNSNNPMDIQQRQKLDKNILEHIKRGQNIPLNSFYVSHLANKINPYDIRGTGLLVGVFRQLMLFDRLREAKFAQAANLINPLTLVKIGGENYFPKPEDLEDWRTTFEEAQNDPDFKIFTHDKVTVERVGAQGGIVDTSADITQLIKEIFMGLMVPSVLMDGGQDTTYANGGVALDVLRQRYMSFRNMLSFWLRRRIFAPISKINDFYEYKDNKKVLIVPDVEWNHMSLFDMGDYVGILKEITVNKENKISSYQTLFRSLGLDYKDEVNKIRQEDIDEAIRTKEKETLLKMSLNELRAMKPTDEIKEIAESPLPGEERLPGQEGQEGGMPGGGGGGGGGGGEAPPGAPPGM